MKISSLFLPSGRGLGLLVCVLAGTIEVGCPAPGQCPTASCDIGIEADKVPSRAGAAVFDQTASGRAVVTPPADAGAAALPVEARTSVLTEDLQKAPADARKPRKSLAAPGLVRYRAR
jgi:hypothetical protein